MSLEFRVRPHSTRTGHVIELWDSGQFVGQITTLSGDDGIQHGFVGIRVMSKHPMTALAEPDQDNLAPSILVILKP